VEQIRDTALVAEHQRQRSTLIVLFALVGGALALAAFATVRFSGSDQDVVASESTEPVILDPNRAPVPDFAIEPGPNAASVTNTVRSPRVLVEVEANADGFERAGNPRHQWPIEGSFRSKRGDLFVVVPIEGSDPPVSMRLVLPNGQDSVAEDGVRVVAQIVAWPGGSLRGPGSALHLGDEIVIENDEAGDDQTSLLRLYGLDGEDGNLVGGELLGGYVEIRGTLSIDELVDLFGSLEAVHKIEFSTSSQYGAVVVEESNPTN